VFAVRREPKRLPLQVKWDKAQLRKSMWTVASQFNTPAKNATLFVDASGVQVIPETPGRAINVGETLKQLQQKYYAGLPAVEATIRRTPARITAASLAGTDVLLGEYVTRFNARLWGRTRNIEVASATVDGKVLMPGQEFSFNKTTGQRTWEKGYRMAHIFERKPGKEQAEVVDGLAGGVCQVSSTLYNAVRKSNQKASEGFEIVERNHHSLPVDYVPYGLDATVAWPIKDFRFKNSLSHPVYLRSTVEGNRLRIGVWARVPDGQTAAVAATTPENNQQNS
jgi:vancomycin resistance protein YoaR